MYLSFEFANASSKGIDATFKSNGDVTVITEGASIDGSGNLIDASGNPIHVEVDQSGGLA